MNRRKPRAKNCPLAIVPKTSQLPSRMLRVHRMHEAIDVTKAESARSSWKLCDWCVSTVSNSSTLWPSTIDVRAIGACTRPKKHANCVTGVTRSQLQFDKIGLRAFRCYSCIRRLVLCRDLPRLTHTDRSRATSHQIFRIVSHEARFLSFNVFMTIHPLAGARIVMDRYF